MILYRKHNVLQKAPHMEKKWQKVPPHGEKRSNKAPTLRKK